MKQNNNKTIIKPNFEVNSKSSRLLDGYKDKQINKYGLRSSVATSQMQTTLCSSLLAFVDFERGVVGVGVGWEVPYQAEVVVGRFGGTIFCYWLLDVAASSFFFCLCP